MADNRSEAGLVDVLDRVLDKGIVIDAHVRVSVSGIELVAVEARVVVASIQTYLLHADSLATTSLAAAPPKQISDAPPRLLAEAVEPPAPDAQADVAEPRPPAPDPPIDPASGA